jgi:hypothetical protein
VFVGSLALAAAGCGGGHKAAPPKVVSHTFVATGDAYIRKTEPGTNFGKNTELRIDGSPPVRTYIQFQPFAVPGRIERALLRVYPLSTSGDGFQVRTIMGAWSESRINFKNAPKPARVINISGPLAKDTWHEIDVTKLLRTPDGTVGLVLVSLGPTEIALASRETPNRAPQLIIKSTPPAKGSSGG